MESNEEQGDAECEACGRGYNPEGNYPSLCPDCRDGQPEDDR